ncbi:MAG: TetR/AcrR family transcriptional regulator [Chloroflexota bacterium]|jgi:AcrR family transcriptional regulator
MVKKRWLNRERVIAQAAVLANEAGRTEAVTLTALAKALDIRVPSLYNHVNGLDDLYYGLAVYGLEQLLEELRAVNSGQVGQAALLALANAYRRFAQQQPGVYLLTIRAPDPDEEALLALSHELVQLLLLVFASVGLTGNEALHAIRGFRALLHGFVALEGAGGFKMDLDREESFERLVTAYLDGLAW